LKKKEKQSKIKVLIKKEMFKPNSTAAKPVSVALSEENNYLVLKPVEEEKKEEIKPETSKKIEKPKLEELKQVKPVEEKKIDEIEKSIETIKAEEARNKEKLIDMVETDIDKLMRILDEKKVMNIGDLSKELKISLDRLESWAKTLEDHGLVEIEYPIIGLPRVRKKEWKEES
jgi:hypothetical protein